MNWTAIILIGLGALAFIVFLTVRNWKDEKQFEDQLNNDYPKPKDDKDDVEIEEETK